MIAALHHGSSIASTARHPPHVAHSTRAELEGGVRLLLAVLRLLVVVSILFVPWETAT